MKFIQNREAQLKPLFEPTSIRLKRNENKASKQSKHTHARNANWPLLDTAIIINDILYTHREKNKTKKISKH